MRKFFLVFLFALSCSIANAQKVKLISKQKGTSIKLLVFNSYLGRIDTTMLGIDSVEYKLKEVETIFCLEKKGFKTETFLLSKKEAKSKKNRVVFADLLQIPKKDKLSKFFYIDKVSFNVKGKDYKKRYYEGYLSYVENKTEHVSNMNEDVIVEHSIFEDRLDHFLLKEGFIDTTTKLTLGNLNDVEFDINISSVTEHKAGTYIVVDIEGEMNLDNKITKKKITFKSSSSITYEYDLKNDGGVKPLFEDALERAVLSAYNDPSVRELFKNTALETNSMLDKWNLITITAESDDANLENSVASVVTVVQKGSHGSGCVISHNGYIVTNHHVVGTDTSGIFVLFSNGAKKKCKVIRTNPLYDLALLKVDTVFNHSLKVNKEQTIKVGADVYAIGTPKDVDLGQSVTKGIISAKRKIEEREYIQTDVSINAGNSGGALTNKIGELIGVVNAKLVGRGIEGVGFAIPAYFIERALKIEIK